MDKQISIDDNSLFFNEYNRSNKERARDLRKAQTRFEFIIWENILRKKQTGYIFLRQKMIGSFILDFYCSKLLLGIEIDGNSHNEKEQYDKERDERIRHKGIKVIRFTNDEIINDIEGVKEELKHIFDDRKNELVRLSNSLPGEREG